MADPKLGLGVAAHGDVLAGRKVCSSAEVPVKSKLKDLRQQHNWSQADVAERLKVSRQTVNAIETEKYDPSLPLAFKIAKLFRLSIEEVFEP
jgi:putative transcriptional regulator